MAYESKHYEITKGNKITVYTLITVGLLSIIYGFASGHTERAWANLLLSNFYLMAIALGAVFFLAVQYVAEVGWSVQVKRVLMAMGTYMPIAVVMMILIFVFGHHHLYDWTHEENYDTNSAHYDEILDGKSGFLNMGFYVFRLIAYAAIWAGFALWIRRESLREDDLGGTTSYFKMSKMSATFLVLFAVSSSTSAWDILMSIDAHWFSTMYSWYTLISSFVAGMSLVAIYVIYLKNQDYLEYVTEEHLHDIGKFMFAFSVFWTYLWYSQFMLIWYANIPEETIYFKPRMQGVYRGIFFLNLITNFAVPFLLLMRRGSKRNFTTVTFLAVLIILGHWVDFYQMVMPGTVHEHYTLGWFEFGILALYAGLIMFFVGRGLAKKPLVAKYHPFIKESTIHHT
jgi:Ca2+/Na+ antiporter